MSVTEKRWREKSGQQYLADGISVRCQAISKGQARKWRLENDDYETPTDELWPECQCTHGALPGAFVCFWHGGKSKLAQKARGIVDVVPYDLGEKIKILLDDPYYISRREDIALLRARQYELLESLQETLGSEEAWGTVDDALYELMRGNDEIAAEMLKKALQSTKDTKHVWDEMYKLENVLKDMTGTEVKTAKEMRTMATAEQVGRLMSRMYDILMYGAEKYIDNKQQQTAFLQYVARELTGAVNFGAFTVSGELESGSREED